MSTEIIIGLEIDGKTFLNISAEMMLRIALRRGLEIDSPHI